MADDHEPAPSSPPAVPEAPRLTPRDMAAWMRVLRRCLHVPPKVIVHAPGRRRGPRQGKG